MTKTVRHGPPRVLAWGLCISRAEIGVDLAARIRPAGPSAPLHSPRCFLLAPASLAAPARPLTGAAETRSRRSRRGPDSAHRRSHRPARSPRRHPARGAASGGRRAVANDVRRRRRRRRSRWSRRSLRPRPRRSCPGTPPRPCRCAAAGPAAASAIAGHRARTTRRSPGSCRRPTGGPPGHRPGRRRGHRQMFTRRRARDDRPPRRSGVECVADRREPPRPDPADDVEPAAHDRGAGGGPCLRQIGEGSPLPPLEDERGTQQGRATDRPPISAARFRLRIDPTPIRGPDPSRLPSWRFIDRAALPGPRRIPPGTSARRCVGRTPHPGRWRSS